MEWTGTVQIVGAGLLLDSRDVVRAELAECVVSAANRINRDLHHANDAVRLRLTASCGLWVIQEARWRRTFDPTRPPCSD